MNDKQEGILALIKSMTANSSQSGALINQMMNTNQMLNQIDSIKFSMLSETLQIDHPELWSDIVRRWREISDDPHKYVRSKSPKIAFSYMPHVTTAAIPGFSVFIYNSSDQLMPY